LSGKQGERIEHVDYLLMCNCVYFIIYAQLMTTTANCYHNIHDECRVHYCNLPTGVPRFQISEMTYYSSSGASNSTYSSQRSVYRRFNTESMWLVDSTAT